MLIVFGGLPATGKTTISRGLAVRRSAAYLRIDVIEQAIRASGMLRGEVGAAGYLVANALAASNLANGQLVIADCVNPVRESREGWRATAARAQTAIIEVEVVCSDPAEHRRRAEQRQPDIEGLDNPSWEEIVNRDYAPWLEPHLTIDTAGLSPAEAIQTVSRYIEP